MVESRRAGEKMGAGGQESIFDHRQVGLEQYSPTLNGWVGLAFRHLQAGGKGRAIASIAGGGRIGKREHRRRKRTASVHLAVRFVTKWSSAKGRKGSKKYGGCRDTGAPRGRLAPPGRRA